MTTIVANDDSVARAAALLLRETNHRFSNDLQLIVSLLGLQIRRAANPEVRQALTDAMSRVSILARARETTHGGPRKSLEAALEQVCEALRAYAEPRSIQISLKAEHEGASLSETAITTLALVVNELTTNAIKHAFNEDEGGHIRISIGGNDSGDVSVRVEDDGRAFTGGAGAGGLGLGLAKRLMASIGGVFTPPPPGSKVFELRISAAGPDDMA